MKETLRYLIWLVIFYKWIDYFHLDWKLHIR